MIIYLSMPGRAYVSYSLIICTKRCPGLGNKFCGNPTPGKHQFQDLLIPENGASGYFLYFTASLTILLKGLKNTFYLLFLDILHEESAILVEMEVLPITFKRAFPRRNLKVSFLGRIYYIPYLYHPIDYITFHRFKKINNFIKKKQNVLCGKLLF